MSLHKDLNELLNAGVIDSPTADRITNYFEQKKPPSSNRLIIVFGVLGAILVSLGIILILAHNWDDLSRFTKTIIAFIPLLIGQGLCGYALLKKNDSDAWRESSSAFLFFAVAASISLISQVYNIPGNMTSFLLTWMLLCLPLIYIMRSSIASILYLCGITWYACEAGYWGYPREDSYLFWPLFIAALPHYYLLIKNRPKSNFLVVHNWIIPLAIIITLGLIADEQEELMFICYVNLFGLLYLIGNNSFLKKQALFRNGFRVLGAIGTVIILLMLSFTWFWEDLRTSDIEFADLLLAPEFLVAVLLTALAGILFFKQSVKKSFLEIEPIAPVFLLFILTFIIGLYSPIAAVLINLITFSIGVMTINKGIKENHFGILNYGLLIITALVLCRFFDTQISFILRGLLFVAVGIGFFVTNYYMLKKRNAKA